MGLFDKFKKKTQEEREFEEMMKRMEYVKAQTRISFMSPSFAALYSFQQTFLPELFYNEPEKLLQILREGDVNELSKLYNESSENICLMNNENSTIEIREYSNKKVIVKLFIKELDKVVLHKWKMPLCKSLYLSFYIDKPEKKCLLFI